MRTFILAAFLLPLGVTYAQSVPKAYHELLRAQYAARTPAPPLSPAEAQRIYDAYLASRGEPVNKVSSDSGQAAGMATR